MQHSGSHPAAVAGAVLVVLSVALAGCADPPPYEAYVVKVCDAPDLQLKKWVGQYMDRNDPSREATAPGMIHVGVISGADRLVLVNSGIAAGDKRVKDGEFPGHRSPVEILEQQGWRADQFTDLILTEANRYSTGYLDAFPGAMIHVQRDEARYNPSDSLEAKLTRLEDQGRAVFHRGDSEVAPGILLYSGGRVTEGNQAVSVSGPDGKRLLFTGALAPLFANIDDRSGPPRGNTRHGASRALRKLIDLHELIVPSRDRGLEKRLDKVADRVWRVM